MKKFDSLATLKKGNLTVKSKSKLSEIGGATQSGEQFKCFNVMLIDQQVCNLSKLYFTTNS